MSAIYWTYILLFACIACYIHTSTQVAILLAQRFVNNNFYLSVYTYTLYLQLRMVVIPVDRSYSQATA